MSKNFWSFKKTPSPAIKVDKSELKKRLTPIQYRVTQDAATERPFSGEYLKLKDNGMYACVVCGEELFSSSCKYESGCGWPAFYDTEDEAKLIYKPDLSHVGGNIILLALKPDLVRTEVTCGNCGSHLGHVFDDGPKPTGKRYCINSASLKFNRISSSKEEDRQEGESGSSIGPKAEPDKRQEDVINNTADRSACNDSVILQAAKLDQQKAVKQSNEADPVTYKTDTLSSSSRSTALTFATTMSSVKVDAGEESLKTAARKPPSGILSERMRFFTSSRDAAKYKAEGLKNNKDSPGSRTATAAVQQRNCAADATAAAAGASGGTLAVQRECRPSSTFTSSTPLSPASKSTSQRSSWFSSVASGKGSETASAS